MKKLAATLITLTAIGVAVKVVGKNFINSEYTPVSSIVRISNRGIRTSR